MFMLMRAVIARVPRGRVITYGEVAERAGFPGAARQAVWALRGARGLPWHRVVAAGGRIALPGEQGLEQRIRLESEGVAFRGARVRMDQHGVGDAVLSSNEHNPGERHKKAQRRTAVHAKTGRQKAKPGAR